MTPPVLVVGCGLIGSSVRDWLLAVGRPTVTVGCRESADPDHRALDVASEGGIAGLRAELARLRPQCVVLTHGPSDVTWIEDHEAEAAAVHWRVADLVAGSGSPAILVSTDNVFAGDHGGQSAGEPADPRNAYGRVKARTEQLFACSRSALILRVCLVYGWTTSGRRPTYAERCLRAALSGRPVLAPHDQIFAPVYRTDAGRVIAGLTAGPALPTGILHLPGPVQLSRWDFARLAYAAAGADPGLVRPCSRRETEWACRPPFSSLAADDFTHYAGLSDWQPASPAAGLRMMLAERGLPRPSRAARP